MNNASPRSQVSFREKTQCPGVGNISMDPWALKQYRLLPFLFRMWWLDSMAKDTAQFDQKTQRDLAGAELEAFF